MKRLLRALVIAAAVGAVSWGVRLYVGDLWTQTRGIGAGLVVLGAAVYFLVAY